MSLVDAVMSAVRRELRRFDGLVEYVTDIVMDADGTADCKGAKTDDDQGHPIDAAVAWQLGFYSRPLDGASGVVVKSSGKGGVAFLVGWRNRKYEIALEKGEVAIANEAGAVIKLDKNGKVSADAKTGQDIVLNGGTAKVARVGDATAGHVHAAGTLVAGMYTVTGATASATDTINQGANNVKA
jgi:phage gp45-like